MALSLAFVCESAIDLELEAVGSKNLWLGFHQRGPGYGRWWSRVWRRCIASRRLATGAAMRMRALWMGTYGYDALQPEHRRV